MSSCSNFPERPTETELAANKSVLSEKEHLRGEISDKELDSLRAVLSRNADVFSKHKADIGCCNLVQERNTSRAQIVRPGTRQCTGSLIPSSPYRTNCPGRGCLDNRGTDFCPGSRETSQTTCNMMLESQSAQVMTRGPSPGIKHLKQLPIPIYRRSRSTPCW